MAAASIVEAAGGSSSKEGGCHGLERFGLSRRSEARESALKRSLFVTPGPDRNAKKVPDHARPSF